MWPDLLDKVKELRRYTWILLSQNAQVVGLDGGVLTVGFKSAGARDSFVGGGSEEILRQAAIDVIGADWKVEAIVDPSADPSAGGPTITKPAVAPSPPSRPAADPERVASARSNIAPTRSGEVAPKGPDERDVDAHPDDPDVDDGGVDATELHERGLGATVIDEISHD
jgi:DNA polymerase-3 subunit gamma/tau